jgi:cell division initiation protein
MRYTPVELRHVRLRRSFFGGYKRGDADVLLSDVADSFEDVWRERGELVDKLEDVEGRLEEIKQREALLASTLIAAEKTAAEAVEAAKREAEIILAEAHQEGRSITRAAQNERERLFAEARRVETLLRAALGMVEETRAGGAASVADEEPEPDEPSVWPNRENTREFDAASVEEALAEQAQPDADDGPGEPAAESDEERDDAGDDIPWSGRDFAWG